MIELIVGVYGVGVLSGVIGVYITQWLFPKRNTIPLLTSSTHVLVDKSGNFVAKLSSEPYVVLPETINKYRGKGQARTFVKQSACDHLGRVMYKES